MTPIPVICDNCGELWITEDLLAVGSSATADVATGNYVAAPCPFCHGSGHTIDGDSEITSAAVQIFTRLPPEIRRLLDVDFKHARRAQATQDELAQRIDDLAVVVEKKTQRVDGVAADVRAIAREVQRVKASDWGTWLGDLIGSAGLATAASDPSSGSGPVTTPPTTTAPGNPATVPVGRNVPCSCGSGQKYKFCHGRM